MAQHISACCYALARHILMAALSKALRTSDWSLSLTTAWGFESKYGHVRMLPVTWDLGMVVEAHSGLLHQLQLAGYTIVHCICTTYARTRTESKHIYACIHTYIHECIIHTHIFKKNSTYIRNTNYHAYTHKVEPL